MKKNVVVPNDKTMSTGTTAAFKGRIERDIDELVHSGDEELFREQNHEDPDDRVHQPDRSKSRLTDQINNWEDPDDLVHDYRDEDDDER